MRHPTILTGPDLLTSHGLRNTRQRQAVYEALAATKAHPTAEELHRAAAPYMRGLSLATVYNVLEALCRCGLAQKLTGDNGTARYDANIVNHPHLRDQNTGRMLDVPDDLGAQLLAGLSKNMLARVGSRTGYRITRVNVELVGERIGRGR